MVLEYINKKYSSIKQILKSEFQISDRLIAKLKTNNAIFINNNATGINTSIKVNDIVKIDLNFNEQDNENIIPVKMNLDIIYEDEGLLVINKHYNTPVHPSILHFNDTLSNGVKFYFISNNIHKKIRPVNRLDKDTTGIVIFAKNQYIQEALIKQMNNNLFKKEYYAILDGHLGRSTGTINANISRKNDSIIEREVNTNGEIAITNYELIKNFEYEHKELSFVKFILKTGRTHQLRVHSKYIGHPILGDSLYGNKSNLISRQALHAFKVSFINPVTHHKLTLESNIPDDMNKIVKGSL